MTFEEIMAQRAKDHPKLPNERRGSFEWCLLDNGAVSLVRHRSSEEATMGVPAYVNMSLDDARAFAAWVQAHTEAKP